MDAEELTEALKVRHVPERIIKGLVMYALHGRPTGGFLRAVLANDFLEAVFRADSINRLHLEQIANAVYSVLPGGCHGSYATVDKWIEKGGLVNDDKQWSNVK